MQFKSVNEILLYIFWCIGILFLVIIIDLIVCLVRINKNLEKHPENGLFTYQLAQNMYNRFKRDKTVK